MKRQLQLRQIEAFKALIEQGTVSRAAEVLHVTQPAVSKLLVHLEEETGLLLFERVKGRLTATAQGMRLYGEVDRVFAGLRQIEEAIAIIRRKDMSHFAIGVLPELSGSFIRRATMMFLSRCPDVRPTIHMRASNIVSDRVATRQMDVGFTTSLMSSPNSVVTPIMESPLVCIMPKGHPLSQLEFITPEHIEGIPFIGYAADNRTTSAFNDAIRSYGVDLNVVLESETTPTLCEFVSAGLGISLVHPLSVIDMSCRLDIRRFKPDIPEYFHFCHARLAKNIERVQEYERCAKQVAEEAWTEIFGESATKQT